MNVNPRLKIIWENHRSTILVFLLIGILGIGAILYPQKEYPAVPEERLVQDPFLGREDAPVTIIEYADFACSGCKLFHNAKVKEEILALYADQVKFLWRDNAHLSSASRAAANAAQCAYDQGFFWEYHDLLFENPIGFSEDGLKSYGRMLGLDSEIFDTCIEEGTYMKKVIYNMKLAGENGLSTTPSFLVNDKIIIGPPSSSYLSDVISTILDELD